MFTNYIISALIKKTEKGQIRTDEDTISIDLQSTTFGHLVTFSNNLCKE